MDDQPKQRAQVKHPKKQEYYRRKRAERLAYQHKYYHSHKDMISRKMELIYVLDPDEHAKIKQKRAAYMREYRRKRRNALIDHSTKLADHDDC